MLLQHVTVAARASIGDHVIVLPAAIVSHDVEVGDYSCIAGGACLSGRVHVGAHCYVGSNASVRQGVRISARALVGMGAAVVDDVPHGQVGGRLPDDACASGVDRVQTVRQLGLLVKGDEGAALVSTADSWMTGQGVVNPARLARTLTPW